jgi:DNA-nicking Smr family endonuclease
MSRRPRPDEVRLWATVTATVRPGPGRAQVIAPADTPQAEPSARPAPAVSPPTGPGARKPAPGPAPPPTDIEPGRKRRIVRERDPIDWRLDLHGLDQDRARAALVGFLVRAQAEGARAVLVITGKGVQGDGVLRRRTPDWLADPALRTVVAGVSEAHRRHGGQGALYVALKRRPG